MRLEAYSHRTQYIEPAASSRAAACDLVGGSEAFSTCDSGWSRWLGPTRRCCCSARPAPARAWPRTCSPPEPAPRGALRQRRLHVAAGDAHGERAVRARDRARSPTPARRRSAGSSSPTAGRFSSTRSASCRRMRSRSCCACCSTASSSGLARRGRSAWTCASSRRPTGTSPRRSRPAGSGAICTIASVSFRLPCRPFVSGRTTSLRSRHHLVDRLAQKHRSASTRCRGRSSSPWRSYDWPGNVRELENVLERAIITTPDSTLRLLEPLTAETLEVAAGRADHGAGGCRAGAHPARAARQRLADRGAAGGPLRALGLRPSTLRSRMRKLGVRRDATDAPRNGGYALA